MHDRIILRVASIIWNENSRTIQEHFKNISRIFQEHINTFQEYKWRWKYYNNWFEGFLKKAWSHNKESQMQISTRTKLRKSYHHKLITDI